MSMGSLFNWWSSDVSSLTGTNTGETVTVNTSLPYHSTIGDISTINTSPYTTPINVPSMSPLPYGGYCGGAPYINAGTYTQAQPWPREEPNADDLNDPMFVDLWEQFKNRQGIGANDIRVMLQCVKPYIAALEEANRILSQPRKKEVVKISEDLDDLADTELLDDISLDQL